MSSLKPLRKPETRPVRRGTSAKAAAAKKPPIGLIAAGVLAVLLVVVGALIVRARAESPIPPSNIPISQAVRALNAPVTQTNDGFWSKGKADAPVVVTVFGDFQCPSCQAAFYRYEGGIDTNYVETGKVRFVFHDFPLPMHPNATPAAKAARAAGAQGKFWSMHDVLYARQLEWANDSNPFNRFKSYAAELGMDTKAFESAYNDQQTAVFLNNAIKDGDKAGINATPTYRVDGKTIDTANLTTAIDEALKAKGR